MASPRYDTDSKLAATFSITFYAATQSDADAQAAALLTRIFGSGMASLMDQTSVTNTVLSGQDITGANYTYSYALSLRAGGSDAATPFYNTIAAATAANALASLQANAQRQTNITNFPPEILWLKAE